MNALIVGAGLGGLLCALELRAAGIDVTLIERAEELGGRARSPTLGGVPCNLGPRAIYRHGALDRALTAHHVRVPTFAPRTAGTRVLIDDEIFVLPHHAPALLASSFLSARAKRELGLVLARVTVGALDVREGESVAAWLDRHLHEPRARALVLMLVRVATYDPNPAQDAARALTQVRRALTAGVRYTDDGWQSVVTALHARAQERGVRVLHATVARAERERAHLSDGRVLDGAVFVAAGPASAQLSGARVEHEVTASCLDVVARALPDPSVRVLFGADAPLYWSVHTRADTPGPVRVHLMRYGARADAVSTLEALLARVQPGAEVVEARALPRMVVAQRLAVDPAGPRVIHEDGGLLVDGVVASALRQARAFIDARARRAA